MSEIFFYVQIQIFQFNAFDLILNNQPLGFHYVKVMFTIGIIQVNFFFCCRHYFLFCLYFFFLNSVQIQLLDIKKCIYKKPVRLVDQTKIFFLTLSNDMNHSAWPGFESRTYCFQDRRAYQFGHQALLHSPNGVYSLVTTLACCLFI